MRETEDQILFEKIKTGDTSAFEILFHRYYRFLCLYASSVIHDDDEGEEIVQEMFFRIWDKRNQLEIRSSVKNYLYRSVKNLCINYITHNKIKSEYTGKILSEWSTREDGESYFEPELAEKIEKYIDELPEKRKNIFRMSREAGLKYHEIAEQLGISVKTVEAQMGMALKMLRDKLKDYRAFVLFYIFSISDKG